MKKYIPNILSGVGVLFIFLLITLYLKGRIKDFESLGYFGVFLMGVIGSASPVWPMPGSWASFIAGGLGWNIPLIAICAGLGEPIGELTGYMLGYSGEPAVRKLKFYGKMRGFMERHGLLTLFVLSCVPNWFIKFADAGAGALRVPLWKFFLVLVLGKTIKSLAFALAGAGVFPFLKELIGK